jgi:hypothetical protein
MISYIKTHGVVYTPDFIAQYILDKTLVDVGSSILVMDPACGDGAFILPAIERIYQLTGKPYDKIIAENIFGIDIDEEVVKSLTNKLLQLYNPPKINIFCGNSLDKQFINGHLSKFDVVVGNPPYVRIQNVTEPERVFLRDWEHATGNTDTYVAFIDLAIEMLKPGGTMAYIVASSWLRNKSQSAFVDWLLREQWLVEVCDFQKHQLFSGFSTYTSILVCRKQKNQELQLRLPKESFGREPINLHGDLAIDTKCYPISRATFNVRNSDASFIDAVENACYKLKNSTRISVGLATLADGVFFIPKYKNHADHIQFWTKDGMWRAEHRILKPCIKVSTLHNEADLDQLGMIIFPYYIWGGKTYPWTEQELHRCPMAELYLMSHEERLRSRDRGKMNKESWFHYGRSQGLRTLCGRKLLVPPLVLRPKFLLSEQQALLFLSGYAIFEKNPELDILTIKAVLESDIFARYLQLRGKDNRDGWKSINKTLLSQFSIPHFSKEEKVELLSLNPTERNAFLRNKYCL